MTNRRNIYWSRYEPKNFGDWINPYLFKKITGTEGIYCPPTMKYPTSTMFGAGSILRHIKTPGTAIIWGSGIISLQDSFERPRQILAVRGPITRRRCLDLGFDCPEVFGDPAILLPDFYQPVGKRRAKYALGIIPHYFNYELAKDIFSFIDNAKIIDVTQPVEKVIDEINQCNVTLSSSLHGLIVSHAYGVKSTWVEFGEPLIGDGTKFLDYFMAFEPKTQIKAVKIDSSFTIEDLISIAEIHEIPKHSELTAGLVSSCPFYYKK